MRGDGEESTPGGGETDGRAPRRGAHSRRAVLLSAAGVLPSIAGWAGGETDVPGADERVAGQEADGKAAEAVVGELVEGDAMAMVVEDVDRTEALGEFEEADSENVFVVTTMAVKNESDEFVDFNSFLQMRLRDEEHRTYNPSFAGNGRPMEDGQLAPGELARGDVAYEVPEDAEGLVLQFDFAAFDPFRLERALVDLDSEADDVESLQQDLLVDVHEAGDSVAQNDLTVGVDDVRTTTELEGVTEADEDHEYVVPTVSVTNETGEETPISIALQMAVKDGDGWLHQADVGSHAALDRAFDQGSDLGHGETRRGEIAYLVPETAEPLYWVFEFGLFADGTKAFWRLR